MNHTRTRLTSLHRLAAMFLAAALLLSLPGCSGSISPEEAAAEQERFDAFTDELFVSEITENILNLHWTLAQPEQYGIEEYKVSLGTFSAEANEESLSLTRDYLETLENFRAELLTDEQQLTYEILTTYLKDSLETGDYRLYYDLMSPVNGVQTYLPTLLAEYTFYREQDVDDYLEILRLIPSYYEELIAFEQEQSAAGFFMPDFEADKVIEQCRQFMTDPETHYLIDSFNERLDETDFLTEEEKEARRAENAELIENAVIPAYAFLIEELEKLKGTGINDSGLCYFKDGKKFYELLVRESTGSARTVDEIEKLFMTQLNEDADTVLQLSAEDETLFSRLEDCPVDLSDPVQVLNDLKSGIGADFPAPADVSFEVNYVPESIQEYMNPAYYIVPPIDYLENNVIYINPAQFTESISSFATLAHEGFPGHLYQTTFFYSQNPSAIRRLLSFSGYSEGWGTYAERYSYALSGLDENAVLANQANLTYTFALYCLSDIGINYHGWTQETTASFLAGFGIDEDTAGIIYETMVEEPALYLSYGLGCMEFLELRRTAEEELGDAFDLKEFHSFLLETGPAQFEIISEEMEEWMRL